MPEPTHHTFADLRRRAVELSAALDAATDEATARPLADELHELMDLADEAGR